MFRNTPLSKGFLNRRAFFGLAAASGGVVGLSSCGMQSGDGGGDASATLTAAFDRPILDLNPFGSANVEQATLMAAALIFDSLVVRTDEGFSPHLAAEWSQPDENTWVFTLADVSFHDGAGVAASDVKACIESIAAGSTPQSSLWSALDSVEATDEKTVTIRTSSPLGTMLSNLSLVSIAPADKVGDESFFATKPIGSGPFQVDSFTASDHLNLTAVADYWAGAPASARLEFPYIPENSTRLTALKTDEVDVTWSIPPDQIAELDEPGVEVVTAPSFINYFNWFNSSREPFTDVRVRRAMWMAIDIEQVVNDLFTETAEVATAPIPSAVFGYSEQDPYPYDPEKARQLLTEAGLADGFSTHVMWAQGVAPQARALAESFASYWSEIGVTVELQELEQAQWLDRLLALDWDMDLQNAANATGDADYTLGRLYTTDANRMGYSNPELDEILNAARSTTDQDQRAELYAQACQIIWEDAVGIFPLDPLATYGIRDGVEGLVPAPNNQPDFRPVHRSE
ncbi:ABC transporter substrate-binding protein [Brachybacterium tyrofermentans]|uniref:ABC transporter substrate-binding protein n=1 Tax=Brachybacterium tyrofermentans TaxID=47848 RepID=UPI003FD52116